MRDINTLIEKLKKLEKTDPVGLAYISGRVDASLEIKQQSDIKRLCEQNKGVHA